MDPGEPGTFTQLRSQHGCAKAIIVVAAAIVLSPFAIWFIWATASRGLAPVVLLFVATSLWFAGWFVFSSPRVPTAPPRHRELPYVCETCGLQFYHYDYAQCPSCGNPVTSNPVGLTLAEIARFLNLARREHQDGRLDDASLAAIREYYVPMLERQRARTSAAPVPERSPAEVELSPATPPPPSPESYVPAPPAIPAATAPPARIFATISLPPDEQPPSGESPELETAAPVPEPSSLPAAELVPAGERPEGAAEPATSDRAAAEVEVEEGAAPDAVLPAPPGGEPPPPVAVPSLAPPPVAEEAAPVPPWAEPAIPPVPARPPKVRKPRRTAREVGQVAIGWAAERQADILLYVGAFLLSVSAIIFVAYQGKAVSGEVRVLILSTYALGFLGFGLILHRWERVKEAGPVFVALGAILVPLDFVALRTQVITQEQLPEDVLWFLASSSCAVLYFALAARGYGRLYALPGIPAALAAWASLGSILNLPREWFGPWFAAIAAPMYVAAIARFRRDIFSYGVLGLALFLGIGALVWTQVETAVTGDQRMALPAGYAIATLAVATGLRWRRDVTALAVLPALAALTGATAVWGSVGLPFEWRSPFIAAAAIGYLVIAHYQSEARARAWSSVAALGLIAAVVHAHAAVLQEGAHHAALPATYGLAFIASSGAYSRWRWLEPAAAMPTLAAATLLTTWWAAGGQGIEWYGAFVGVATLGYLALAGFDAPRRTEGWQTSAVCCALLGLGIAHIAVAAADAPDRWALPAAYAPVLLGAAAAFGRWRWEWRLAPGSVPALAALAGVAVAWAGWDLRPEWFPAFAAAAAIGYLPLAHFDSPPVARFWGGFSLAAGVLALVVSHAYAVIPESHSAAIALTYTIALAAAAAAYVRWRWLEPGVLIPPLAAMATLTTLRWTIDLQIEWYGALAAVAGLGYVVLSRVDPPERREAWRFGHNAAELIAVALTQAVIVLDKEAEPLALPLAYGIVFVGRTSAFLLWRWIEAGLGIPPALAMTGLTATWAVAGLDPVWYGAFAATAAPGYAILGRYDFVRFPERVRAWRVGYAAASVLAVTLAQAAILHDPQSEHLALPATFALVLVGAGLAFWFWRWIEAGAVLPPLVAMTALTAIWATAGLDPVWYGGFAASAALGYILLGRYDFAERIRIWRCGHGAAAVFGVALTQLIILDDPAAERLALPLVYAIAFVGAGASFWLWRWLESGATLPPLAVMTALTGTWATTGLSPDWYGAYAAAAALGYVVIARVDSAPRVDVWRSGHAVASVFSLGLAQAIVLNDVDAEHLALPIACALVLAAAGASFWLWRWVESGGALPPLAAMTALTAVWATAGLDPEWYAPFASAAGIGYLLLARFDFPRRLLLWRQSAVLSASVALLIAHLLVGFLAGADHAPLPVTYVIILLGTAAAFVQWRWFDFGGALPPLAAMTAATAIEAAMGLDLEWYGAFAAGGTLGYLLLARFDYPRRLQAWQSASLPAAALALALAHVASADTPDIERIALPITYGILLAGAAGAFARWRFTWRVPPGVLPLLLSMTALTGSWALWDLHRSWFGAFVVAASLGYVVAAARDDPRLALPWLRFGSLVCIAGLALAHGSQAEPAAVRGALPTAYGFALAASAVSVWRWRLAFRDGVGALPAVAAATGATFLWAAVDMPLEWLTAWLALAAAGYAAPVILDERYRQPWRTTSVIAGAMAVGSAHVLALQPDLVRWQLPATYGALLAGWAIQSVRLRDVSLLAPPLLTAVGGATVLWAAGTGQPWWPYPALAVSAAMVVTSQWWEKNRILAAAGWFYAIAIGSVATLATLPADMAHPAHGVAAQLGAGAILVAASRWARGRIVVLFPGEVTSLLRAGERTVLAQAAFAFFFGAAASLNGVLGLEGADRAWLLAIVAMAGWALTALRVRGYEGLWTFVPVGMAGMIVAGIVAAESDATITSVLAMATAGAVAAFGSTRRWFLLGIANSTLFLAVWTAWRWQGLDLVYLPLAFAAIALLEWAALTGLRRYTARPDESDYVITYISWGPWLLSALVSGILLSQKHSRLEASESIFSTAEWGLAAAVLGLAAAAVMAEGLRMGRRWVWVVASAALLGAFLMAIATREPSNIQAYTAPVGAWLIGVSITFRRTPSIFRQQLFVHEAVTIIGALHIVLPPAEQSFEPGGGKFGLELIGIGIALLIVGLLLHARWLVPAAILTLTATSIRMVTGGLFSTPYWLLLGIAGTLLLALGVLILLERERWDRFRVSVVDWWKEAQKPLPPDYPGSRPVP